MNKLLLATLILVFSSCNTNPNEYKFPTSTTNSYVHYGINTFVHDSCEYVIYYGTQKGGITHKGNCKFCKQRNK